MPKPTPIFRAMLKKAWKTTWERKSLWVFGVFAFGISSGGVMDVALRTFQQIDRNKTLLENLIAGSFVGGESFAFYIQQVGTLDQTRVAATLTVLTLAFLAFLVAAIYSQGALVIGILSSKTMKLEEALKKTTRHFWDILLLDVFAKAATFLLLLLTTVPLFVYLVDTTLANTLLFFVLFVLFFPAVVVVSILATLALIDIVKRKSHVTDAIVMAAKIFKKHWLAALELGFLLFFVTLLASIAVGAVLILFLIPYTLLVMLAHITATPFIFVLVQILGFTLLTLFVLAVAGAFVVFQHAAWVNFYERALGLRSKIPLASWLNRIFG